MQTHNNEVITRSLLLATASSYIALVLCGFQLIVGHVEKSIASALYGHTHVEFLFENACRHAAHMHTSLPFTSLASVVEKDKLKVTFVLLQIHYTIVHVSCITAGERGPHK